MRIVYSALPSADARGANNDAFVARYIREKGITEEALQRAALALFATILETVEAGAELVLINEKTETWIVFV